MGWTDLARQRVAQIDAELPATASLGERIIALRKAYPFARRANYPYKAWLRVRRQYLGRHGYRGRLTPIEAFIDAREVEAIASGGAQ
jgi:hypothetical protein